MYQGQLSSLLGNKWSKELVLLAAIIVIPTFISAAYNSANNSSTGGNNQGCNRVCWADANWNYNYYDHSSSQYSFACDTAGYNYGYSTNAGTCIDGNVYGTQVPRADGFFQPNFQCADFVSRALTQDGLIPGLKNGGDKGSSPATPSVGGYNSYYDTANGKTYSLWNVGGPGNPVGLSNYLLDSGRATNVHQDVTQAQPGDPVFFFDNNGQYYHTMLIVAVNNGQLIVDGHNMAQYHLPIIASGLDIYHIKP